MGSSIHCDPPDSSSHPLSAELALAKPSPMTTPFIQEDFLLQTEPARRLFHEYAADLPIIDYHYSEAKKLCHRGKGFGNMPRPNNKKGIHVLEHLHK